MHGLVGLGKWLCMSYGIAKISHIARVLGLQMQKVVIWVKCRWSHSYAHFPPKLPNCFSYGNDFFTNRKLFERSFEKVQNIKNLKNTARAILEMVLILESLSHIDAVTLFSVHTQRNLKIHILPGRAWLSTVHESREFSNFLCRLWNGSSTMNTMVIYAYPPSWP